MMIVETPIFTRRVEKTLTPEEYRNLQGVLILKPEVGCLIRGSGGLRKLRWAVSGRGKRGGIRVIYYWASRWDIILMLYLYAKNECADLTSKEIKVLRKVVEEEYHG